MILLPVGIDNTKLYRNPVVTYSIVGICCLVWLFGTLRQDIRTSSETATTLRYYFQHPYLEIPVRFRQFLIRQKLTAALEVHDSFLVDKKELEEKTPEPGQLQLEQEHFEKEVDSLLFRRGRSFSEKWGITPSQFKIGTIITYMFVHAGFYHLIGNMLFFFFTGPFLEDRWGRPFFCGFFLLSGVLAGLAQVLGSPRSALPVVGASGAIAAVMGAFLVKFTFRKFNFLFLTMLFFRVIHFSFSLPAWLVISLFISMDILLSIVLSDRSFTAHWAHLAGFGSGITTALVLRMSPLGPKLNPGGFDPDFPQTDPREGAEMLELQGREDKALALLNQTAFQPDADPELKYLYWNMALKHKVLPHMKSAAMHLFSEALKDNNAEGAFYYWKVFIENSKPLPILTGQYANLAEELVGLGMKVQAAEVIRHCLDIRTNLSPQQFILLGEQAFRIDQDTMQYVYQRATCRKDLPEDTRTRLASLVTLAPVEEKNVIPSEIALSEGPAVSFELDGHDLNEPHLDALMERTFHLEEPQSDPLADVSDWQLQIQKLRVVNATPLRFNDSVFEVSTPPYGNKIFRHSSVKEVFLGHIAPDAGPPVMILDVFMDHPNQPLPLHRVLRMHSDLINPDLLIKGEKNPAQALLYMAGTITKGNSTLAFSHPEGFMGYPISVFKTIVEMEKILYGIRP